MPTNETNPTSNPASDFDWKVDEETGGVKITGVRNKTATRIVVPEEIDGRPVIYDRGYYGYMFRECDALTEISVAPGNANFRSVDGVLFSADGKKLLHYPNSRPGRKYVVPDGVEVIELDAFPVCRALKSLELSSSVCVIDSVSFRTFWSLEEISVSPGNVNFRSVDGVLFSADGKTLLCYPNSKPGRNYIVPDGVEEIACLAFASCFELQSLTLPASFREFIDDYPTWGLLGGCQRLQEIDVAPGNPDWRSVDGVLFFAKRNWNCLFVYPPAKSGREYVIPQSVQRLSSRAFSGCGELRGVVMTGQPYVISPEDTYNPFNGCRADLTIYAAADNIGAKKHAKAAGLRFVALSAGALEAKIRANGTRPKTCASRLKNALDWECDRDGNVVVKRFNAVDVESFIVPNALGGRPVVRIAEGAFAERSRLKEITLPDSLRFIDDKAFSGCVALTKLKLPNNAQRLGSWAFSDCETLETVELSADLQHLGEGAFYGCKSLRSVILPDEPLKLPQIVFGRACSWEFYGCAADLTFYGVKGSSAEIFSRRCGASFKILEDDVV